MLVDIQKQTYFQTLRLTDSTINPCQLQNISILAVFPKSIFKINYYIHTFFIQNRILHQQKKMQRAKQRALVML